MTEVYNTSISNAVTKTVMELFDAMLSLDVAPADEVTDKALDGSRIVGAVHYTGQIVGVVSVHVGKAFARKIAGAMLGVAREDALDDAAIKDVIGEITNMISGNLSTELVNSGQGCAISAPAITSGPDFDIDPLDVDLTKHLVFKHEESNMVVQLCLKEESVGEEFLIKSDGLTPEAIMEKVNSVDVATTIINSVIDVFYTMLSMEVERLEELPAGFRAQQHIVGSVSFAGDLDGLFNLQVNEDFAQVMTASMLGMEIEEIEGDEEVHDVLREMSNIIGGTLKSSFVDVGLTCQLTIPSITIGKDFRIESLKINKMEQFVFKYEDWLIIVEAGIKKDEIATEEKTQRADAVPDEQGPKAPEAIEAIEALVEKENPEKQEQDNSRNIDFIMDIPLPVTVELGRNKMKINDLLKMGNGAVVELEQVEGEPVDILVNETLIAKGHVVVEKEKYGIRICEIISRKERVNSFK